MQFLRHLQSLRVTLFNTNRIITDDFLKNEAKNYSSYRGVRDWDPKLTVDWDKTSDSHCWKYVERLLPNKYIPQPSDKYQYNSGWWPQNYELLKNESYLVRRSKNYMIPVYLKIRKRGLQRVTEIRHIKGDIWTFERDLKQHLFKKMGKKSLGCRVDELAGKIILRGDYVHCVSEWFKEKGF